MEPPSKNVRCHRRNLGKFLIRSTCHEPDIQKIKYIQCNIDQYNEMRLTFLIPDREFFNSSWMLCSCNKCNFRKFRREAFLSICCCKKYLMSNEPIIFEHNIC